MHPFVRVWLLAGLLFLSPMLTRAQVLLSEFQAANSKTLRDEDGDAEDWLEVRNISDTSVDLAGWFLTDDPARLDKWAFPSTNLPPQGCLVVFASNKDRRTAGAPLHTNFRLALEGEYLALVRPDGLTVATDYTPTYPPQVQDVSYGLPDGNYTNLLLSLASAGKYSVPSGSEHEDTWTLPGFSDVDWNTFRTGAGFTTNGSGLTEFIGTDLSASMGGTSASAWFRIPFSATNLQSLTQLVLRMRYNDGFVAYLNGKEVASRNAPVAATGGTVADSLADWSSAGEQGFDGWYYGFYDQTGDTDGTYNPASDFLNTGQWTWNGAAWVLGPGNPPWDMISSGGWHPNGSNSGGVHWPIRRWISTVSGTITCKLSFGKEDTACGNGATLHVLQNGIERLALTVAFDDQIGINTNLVLAGLQPGDYVDFALDPLGLDGQATDPCDGCTFRAVIEQSPSEGLHWNSPAAAKRSMDETLMPEDIILTSFKDLLVSGTNILAIQGLNASPADPDFLIAPELVATWTGVDAARQVYFTRPTPGQPNGPGTTSLGPIVTDVSHTPQVPLDSDDLLVQARVTPTLAPVPTVTLKYRVMYGAETAVSMYDDGTHGDVTANDGVFAARIPAAASKPGQMVRYFIVATDLVSRSTRAPNYVRVTSPQYFGTVVWDPALTNSHLPVLHWFIANPANADSDVTARCSLFFNGEFYDNVGANLHGQSTRGFPKKSYDLSFNPGYKFRWSDQAPRVSDLNLLTTWGDKTHMRNVLAHETYRDAGAPSHFAVPVRVQQNSAFFSVANIVENGDEEFLERLGLDSRGALYKMYNSAESVDLAEKKTRKEESTADLQALITGLGQSTSSARQSYLFDNLNVPEMIDFLAAKIITADTDCCHKNYYLYRDSDGSGEWQAMPWDVDLSFGRVWTCGSPCYAYYDPNIYTNTSLTVGYGNRVFTPLYDTPATRQMFLRRLRTLMDQLLQAPGVPANEDFYLQKALRLRDQIAPDAALDLTKWGTWGTRETITQAVERVRTEFLPGRRSYLFRFLSVTNRGEVPLAQPADAALVIKSLEYRPASGNQAEEWLCLSNVNNYAVDISGWQLNGGVRFSFQPGTVVPSASAVFVSPDVKAFRRRTISPKGNEKRFVVGPYQGNLSAWGETIVLSDAVGRSVATNTFVGIPSAQQRYLRITELFYNPDPCGAEPTIDPQQFEYIELCNIGAAPLDLRGARFSAGIEFDFNTASATNIEPAGRFFLVRDAQAFARRFGTNLPVLGQFSGRLQNSGDKVRLDDRYGEKILEFTYRPDWFPQTDGHGYSLAILGEYLPWQLWGDPSSWRAKPVPGGNPALPQFNQLVISATNGSYTLLYLGTPGRACQLQRSPDLLHWTAVLSTNVPGSGFIEFQDPSAPPDAAYYRAVQE